MNDELYNKEKADFLFQMGRYDEYQGDFFKAEENYRASLSLAPREINTYVVLTLLLSRMNRAEEIDPIWVVCEKTIPDPWYPTLYRALDLLKHCHFDQGFKLRERLFANNDHNRTKVTPPSVYPRWRGENLQGRSIVIWTEYRLGDELMLCRFAHVLKQLGAAHVSIVCQQPILSIVMTLADADLVMSDQDTGTLPVHDYWVFPLAIPSYYSLETHGIPSVSPYLYADQQKVSQWLSYLPKKQGVLKVGLVWKGNPTHENDHFRSVAHLSLLAPILQLSDIQWVSLQKGSSEQEWQVCTDLYPASSQVHQFTAEAKIPLAFEPVILGEKIDDFSDTVAIMASLDLIISVDTSAAHLAGALAKPVWLLLPTQIDWRWQSRRADSPWYPIMRPFRQKYHLNWSHPLEEMREQLLQCIQRKKEGLRVI